MKKLSIVLLAVFFIGITNVNAQTDAITSDEVTTKEVKKECPFTKNAEGKLVCVKTGKVCDEACKNKAKGTCCKGKRKSACNKSKKGSFNFNKANNYSGGKPSYSCKKAKKCGADCTKPCCAAPPTIEESTPAATEEAVPENE
jgi:hypothetical protein